jgi:aldose 1-epimerase
VASDRKTAFPSGRQIELTRDGQRAVVVEVGGGLRAYTVGERAVLDGYGPREMCTVARGQCLVPWPNRLRDGAYTFDGEDHQLALSEPRQHNAIHGLVRWAGWEVAERGPSRVRLTHRLHAQDGYPFTLDLALEYSLGDRGLTVTTLATNAGERPCPYGAGAHPYLSAGTGTLDHCLLRAPGRRWLPSDDQQIPTASVPVEGTEYDFLTRRKIGDTMLDTGYADLERDHDGLAYVELALPYGEGTVVLWQDEAYEYLMLFSGDSLEEPHRRRRGLGVEPMTCAPNAFQSGAGLRTLQPGETFTSSWGICVDA